ncbi:MAG: hypothetical protein ACT4OY_03845 [Alphaproteobacteria bacterium]
MNDDPKNTQRPDDESFDTGFEDDFDIDVEASDEFPAEDWEDNFDEGGAMPTPVKKRSFFGGKKLLIIMVVFVLGAGWMLLGGEDTAPLPDGSVMPPATEAPIEVDELDSNSDMPPMPAPINAAGEETPAAGAAPDVAVIEDPLLEVPKVPAIPADRKLSEVDVNAAAVSMEPVPVQDSGALLAEKEREMAEKLAALETSWQARFAAMEADLKQKAETSEAKVKASERNEGNEGAALKSLKDENAALKKQLESLKAEQQKAGEEAAAKPAMAPPAPAQAQKADDLWILRSAQPGKALISQKGSDVMQGIKTGDIVPGLGTVISVKPDGSQWVVTGTDGRLSR